MSKTIDISVFMNWFLGELFRLVSWCFNTLSNIKFNNVSLLQISISIVILSAVLNIMLSLAKSKGMRELSNKSKSDSKEGDS